MKGASTTGVPPRVLPRRQSIRPSPLDRPPGEAPTLDEVAAGDIELRLAFPIVYDATTTQGLAALRSWMPDDWPEALSQGRGTHSTPTRESTLTQLLERGSSRALPLDPGDMAQVGNRRSALAHLHDTLPPVVLGELTQRGFEKLVRSYQADRGDLSSAMISAHITELRFLIAEAREEAGLRRLAAPGAARGKQGRRVHRPMASLEEVGRILLRAPRDVQLLVALLMATSALPQHLLRLTRGALDLDGARIRMDTCATRRPDSPAGHLLYGLPRWCADLLRKHHRDIDTWPDDRLLFPSRPNSRRARATISATFRLAADNAGCLHTRLQDIRRLAQAVHAHAPRAVRRATATARRDVPYSMGSEERRKVADAQETYASWVVQHWTHLMHPPVEPRRPPRRAIASVQANEPERP